MSSMDKDVKQLEVSFNHPHKTDKKPKPVHTLRFNFFLHIDKISMQKTREKYS